MRTSFFLLSCLLVTAVVMAVATAAAVTLVESAQEEVPSVAGTMWVGTDSDGDHYEYHFMSDGSLHYRSPTGFSTNATWTQNGNEIYMETNNRYSERRGTITGNQMRGNGWNQVGLEWTWTAEKQGATSAPEEPTPTGPTGVSGTTWAGSDANGDNYEYRFNEDGSLHYESPSGFSSDGTWKQDGNTIYILMDGGRVGRKGTIQGNQMEGEAWNDTGRRWTWFAERRSSRAPV